MKRLIYIVAILLMLTIWLSSCRTQYVPVEKIKTEYRYIDKLQYDSIYLKDSVRYYTKGDTVFRDKYIREYKYLFINRVDSFTKTDSIQVPFPVEKKLSKWQSLKMELGGWAFGIIILFALVFVGWLVYRWRNK